jgi:hypothetical protein
MLRGGSIPGEARLPGPAGGRRMGAERPWTRNWNYFSDHADNMLRDFFDR